MIVNAEGMASSGWTASRLYCDFRVALSSTSNLPLQLLGDLQVVELILV